MRGFLYEITYICTYCGSDYDTEQDEIECPSCGSVGCPNCQTLKKCPTCNSVVCDDCSFGDFCENCPEEE